MEKKFAQGTDGRAYDAGYADGLVWDLSGFSSRESLQAEKNGWDEATINAVGLTEFAQAVGADPESNAWEKACSEYNRGAHEGALAQWG